MKKIEINEITIDDIPDYVKVNIKAWNESYKGILNDEILNNITSNQDLSIKKQIEKFEEEKKNNTKKYILKVNNESVGMSSIGKAVDEKYKGMGEIYSLYLLDKVKKQGYGKLLFYHDIYELIDMNFNNMIIGCLVNNPSNEFYKHMGGRLVDVVNRKVKGYEMKENIYYYENIKDLKEKNISMKNEIKL